MSGDASADYEQPLGPETDNAVLGVFIAHKRGEISQGAAKAEIERLLGRPDALLWPPRRPRVGENP